MILAACHRDGLGPGSRLPTERQLAQDLATTRTSVRHALAVLEADGWISREVGRGTFLRGVPGGRPPGPAQLRGVP
ncbi:MAG: winged helix-turn-helix transcriptional regulator, partial [Actinobacteria bacterium]|nr:winged helix-turn-helix transcriptional regulator [Actinomycetota bacterium]